MASMNNSIVDKFNMIFNKRKPLAFFDFLKTKPQINNIRSSRVNEPPTSVMIEITNRCNLNCKHCARTMMGLEYLDVGDMSFENFKMIFKQFPDVRSVTLTGLGEPLLHPELFQIIEYIKNYREDIRIFMSTNGTLLNDEKIQRLINSGVDDLQISFDGSTPGTSSKVRDYNEKVFNKIIENTKCLMKMKPQSMNVFMNMVLQRENFMEASKIIELAHTIGVTKVMFNVKNFASRADKYQDYELYKSKEFLSEINNAKRVSGELGINLDLSMITLPRKCGYLWDSAYVTWDGYLATCCTIPFPRLVNFGNLLERNYVELRNSKLFMEFRQKLINNNKPEFCKNCHLY